MSTRAYKIIKIESEESESFNVTHNFDLLLGLGNFICSLNEDCAGISTIYRDDVVSEIEEIHLRIQKKWAGHETAEKEEEALEVLESILEDMGNEDYVEYYCY